MEGPTAWWHLPGRAQSPGESKEETAAMASLGVPYLGGQCHGCPCPGYRRCLGGCPEAAATSRGVSTVLGGPRSPTYKHPGTSDRRGREKSVHTNNKYFPHTSQEACQKRNTAFCSEETCHWTKGHFFSDVWTFSDTLHFPSAKATCLRPSSL